MVIFSKHVFDPVALKEQQQPMECEPRFFHSHGLMNDISAEAWRIKN